MAEASDQHLLGNYFVLLLEKGEIDTCEMYRIIEFFHTILAHLHYSVVILRRLGSIHG